MILCVQKEKELGLAILITANDNENRALVINRVQLRPEAPRSATKTARLAHLAFICQDFKGVELAVDPEFSMFWLDSVE